MGGCPLVPSKMSLVVVLFPPSCSAWAILSGVGLPLVQILSHNSRELGTKAEVCSFPQPGYYRLRGGGCVLIEGSQGSDLQSGESHVSRSNSTLGNVIGRARPRTWKQVEFMLSCLIFSPQMPVSEDL